MSPEISPTGAASSSLPQSKGETNASRSNEIKLWLFLLCSFVLALQPTHADVVTDWNMTAVSASQAAGANSLIMSRNVALVHAAIYDAVNAIDRRHTVYAIDVKAKPGASIEAAPAVAAYGVLTKLYWLSSTGFRHRPSTSHSKLR